MGNKVLIACEESQAICIEMRKMGLEAYSADLQECSGGHPEWHIKGDCLPLLNGNCEFETMDGTKHKIDGKWDLLIAHPPCTYLTVSGNSWFNVEKYGEKALKRIEDRKDGIVFFMKFVNADCDRICIENPVGVMSTEYRKPNMIIQPYMFGDPDVKTTCLWTKGLPKLVPLTNEKPSNISYVEWVDKRTGKKKRDTIKHVKTRKLPAEERRKARSKTYLGIAKAIAEQWGKLLIDGTPPIKEITVIYRQLW